MNDPQKQQGDKMEEMEDISVFLTEINQRKVSTKMISKAKEAYKSLSQNDVDITSVGKVIKQTEKNIKISNSLLSEAISDWEMFLNC